MAKQTWMWLAAGLGFGAVNIGELLAAYPGGAEAVEANLGSARMDEILTQKQAARLAASRPADFALRIAHYETMGVETLAYDDPRFPDTLRRISNPPPVLFVKGDTALLNGRLSIGMVGARRPSAYGVEAVKALGRGIALGGAIVVSGLAAGLDSEAHKAALAVNAPTIACIAFGHDHCYPAANKKLMEVIERHGLVISEYPPGTSPEKPYFLQRNRIIAGLSHGLVVVEARKQSGTMSTVNFAIDYGRDVFGVPGSIFSELSGGTNAMISEGAYVASTASDVLQVYGIELQEDPVKATAKQVQEEMVGTVVPVQAQAPWQENLQRLTEQNGENSSPEARREELPGQQTLSQAARQQRAAPTAAESGAAVNRALENFRVLQEDAPATGRPNGRDRALDDRVNAVSDSVEIGRKAATQKNARSSAKGQPHQWEPAERLERSQIEDLSPAGGRSPRAESNARREAPAPVSRVEAVGRIEPIDRIEQVRAVQQAQSVARPAGPAAAPAPAHTPTPAPVPAQPPARPGPATHQGRVQEALAAVLSQVTGQAAQVDVPKAEAVAPDAAQRPQVAYPPMQQAQPVMHQPRQTVTEPVQSEPSQAPAPPPPLRQEPPETVQMSLQPAQTAPQEMPEREQPQQAAPVVAWEEDPYAQRENELVPPGDLLSDTARRALEQLGPTPVSLAEICERSGLSSAEAMAALTELELAGLSRQLAGRQFIINDL